MLRWLDEKDAYDPKTKQEFEKLRASANAIINVVDKGMKMDEKTQKLLLDEIKKTTEEIKKNLWWNPSMA